MNKIKVLYIIDTLEGYGAEKSLVEITSNLKKVTPVFAHIYQGDMLKAKLEDAGIKVYSLDLMQKYGFREALKKLTPLVHREKPDLIHATLFRAEIIARKLKNHFPGIPLIGSFVSNAYSRVRYHNKSFMERLKLDYIYRLDKNSVKQVDFFISNSHTIKENTGKKLGIDPAKIKVIYRGRDSKAFSKTSGSLDIPRLRNHDNSALILNVSRLIPLKGQLDIIRAFSLVIKHIPETKLLFAGHGPSRNELEKEVSKHKLQEKVEFLGRVDHINKLLMSADVFVYPSYSEGLPGALIEAMMAGKIIIASNIPENLECVNEDCALIFEKGNIEELADKITRVLRNPSQFQIKAKLAREMAIEKFETGKIVGEYEEAYKSFYDAFHKSDLKILHLIQKPQHRGAETFTCQLAKHQKNAGMEVKIVSVYSGDAELNWDEQIINLEGNPNSRFADYKAWRILNQLIRSFNPDIIQANAGDTLKYAVFSKKVFGWNTPVVFRNASEVGRYLKSGLQKKLNSYLYKNVAGVASVSKASEIDILTHFSFLQGKTSVIPVGLEEKETCHAFQFKPKSHKHIVHVGGFSFEKNHKGLLDIFKKIKAGRQNVNLHLVGDGTLRPEIENLVQKENLQDQVNFYGFVNNPLDFIAAADVLVLPSIIEGLPGVILEAMYCKTPVVAYGVGGIKEIVSSETGHLIPENEENTFAQAVLDILEQPNTEQTDLACAMVREKFMNKQISAKFMEMYKRIVEL
ncbi:glycosyltransferase [Salegentibacter sp. JZCK2]|uniref:glycosyltransferase n=1 Tax=Salegentibacter tibetensis TaxID=2873600 RepID=UPI001CCEAD87|nr:glycosyltransferase [Salegentibacter tibetensis]MBZ9729069.1 glycosyltransferase [Salegentibacter tibetensis]